MIHFKRWTTALAVVLGCATVGDVKAQPVEPAVILALDSSRSLSAAESRATADLAKELLAALPAAAKPGILVFDDVVRWLVRPGGAGGAEALDAVTPTGRFTVLNDGLIEGVRALPDGGVLVLLSDGLDENSATTLEDAARLAGERDVRLVTIGAGRADERTLRRLALLTEGRYAGPLGSFEPVALAQEIEGLRRDLAAQRAATAPARVPTQPGAAAPLESLEVGEDGMQAASPAREKRSSGWPPASWLLPVGAALAAFGIVLGFLLARRRTTASAAGSVELDPGTQPGVKWPEVPPTPPVGVPGPATPTRTLGSQAPLPIDEVQIARVRLRPAVRPRGLMEISLDETAEFKRLPFSESIERTLVLTAEVVLTVREPGREPHSYRLPPDRAVDIGREATLNTLAFQDPTMSTQHVRVALDDEEVYLVDLGSTNGVLIGERRVDAVRLLPGDRFRAGRIEFELGLHHASMV